MVLRRTFASGSKAWLRRHVTDSYVQEAQNLGVRTRAFFKLKEIQDKHKFIHSNSLVVDLGAAPGGWSLAVSDIITDGKLCCIDLLPMEPVPRATIIQGDFCDPHNQAQIMKVFDNRKANVVISDMLHSTTGNRSIDHLRSIDLCLQALDFCGQNLELGGHFLCKYRNGSDESELFGAAKEMFHSVVRVKPKASRSESCELFLLAKNKK